MQAEHTKRATTSDRSHISGITTATTGIGLFQPQQGSGMEPVKDILYVGYVLGHGGDAIQMLELAAGAMERGHRVKIIVPALETSLEFAERCRARGVPVERTPWIKADAWKSRQNLLHQLRLLKQGRGKIVHMHTGDVCLPRLTLLAVNLLRLRRVFVTIQSPYETLAPGDSRARTWAKAIRYRFETVFCPSEHSRRTQIQYGVPPEKVKTVHNSVQVKKFRNGSADAVYAALHLPPDTPLIVFTSRLEPQKCPLDAITAFVKVADQHPAAHLVFVGRGTLESACREAVQKAGLEERVHFVGHQSNIPDWLAAATVWMLPTESENFSLAVLEALAAGCPILSTDCPGNDEVLIHEQNALMTRVGDTEAMAKELRRLLTDADLRERLRQGAQETAQAYSVERMVEQYLCGYDAAVQPVARPQSAL